MLFFSPPEQFTSPIWVPHLQVNRPLLILTDSLRTADVFLVVAYLPPILVIFWGERSSERKYVCSSQATLLAMINGRSMPNQWPTIESLSVSRLHGLCHWCYWLFIDNILIIDRYRYNSIQHFFFNITYSFVINSYVRMVRDDNNEKSRCLCPFLTVLKSLFIWSFLRPRLQGSADIFERPKCHGKFFTWSKVGLKFLTFIRFQCYGESCKQLRSVQVFAQFSR